MPPAIAVLALMLAGCSGGSSPTGSADPGGDIDFGVEATATTGVIRGIVVDDAVRPLAGVSVNLTAVTDGPAAAITKADGSFGFEGLEPGDYFLVASKPGFAAIQASATVVAGVDDPPLVRIQMLADPATQPFVESLSFRGFLTFGAAIGITSVGSTINPTLSGAVNDVSIWLVEFTEVPMWAQGELVWEHTQAAGGMLIWEMTKGGTNDFRGYRETAESPALALWNTTVLEAEAENVTGQGINYRFFGGPHPLLKPGGDGVIPPEEQCPVIPTVVLGNRNPCRFGFGLTLQQQADAYVHHFYNFVPPEGWRFTEHGDPKVPQ